MLGHQGCNMKQNRHFDLESAIGNTPLISLHGLPGQGSVTILAKLEGNNPGGSVKDRPAWFMLKSAEEQGLLGEGKVVLEPTSGNTGIAIAMIGAARGYKVKLVMPACVSLERRRVLEAYGAELVLSPAEEATDGAIRMAHKMLAENPELYYMPNQYANPNNVRAHFETTGPEIWTQSGGEVDAFVAGMGTSGTLMGAGRYLKGQNPGIRVIGVEPTLGHAVQGLKNMQEAIVPEIYRREELDEVLTVEDDEAFDMARLLAAERGLFVGMSSGAAVAGALKAASQMKSGTVVTLLPDRGDRYLSTNLFRSHCGNCPP